MPGVEVNLPASFEDVTGGRRRARVRGETVGAALSALEQRHPGLRPLLRTESGELRPFILVFVNSEDIRSRQGEQTPLRDGDTLAIVPAVEGG